MPFQRLKTGQEKFLWSKNCVHGLKKWKLHSAFDTCINGWLNEAKVVVARICVKNSSSSFLQQPQALSRRAPRVFASQDVAS